MKKIHGKGRLLLYAAGGMGVNMLNLMMGSYLCSALLIGGFKGDAIKFQTFAGRDLVIAAAWAVITLIARIVDGVIDIPMAAFTDKLRTRWGRRRPSLVIGLVPMVTAYLLFLVCPNPGAATWLNTIYYGAALIIFYSFYTLTMVTYYATYTEIVDNEEDRRFMSNVKAVCDIIYFILGYVVVRMLLNGLNVRYVALIVLPMVLTMLIPLFMIKESRDEIGATGSGETVGLFRSIKYTFRNRTFILWMIAYSFMTFGVQLFLGGINEYFSFVGMSMIFVMMAAFAPVPFTLMIYNKLMRKRGFGFAFRYTLVTFAVGTAAMFFVGLMPQGTAKTVLSIVTGLICSFAVGSLFSVAYSVPSQLAAEEEEKTGVSNSAMYFAVQGLFSGVATGVGTGIVLVALKNSSKNGSNAMAYMTAIAAVGMIVSLILTFTLPRHLRDMGKKDGE